MGLLDALKRGAGALNEARFNHRPVMVPMASDPDTGEGIEISFSADELENGMFDPSTGQILMPEKNPSMQVQQMARNGPSTFGRIMQGIPRAVGGAVAAATAPGDGSGGGLAFLKGLGIGQRFNQQQDVMAYQWQRQRQQDEAIAEERASRAAENRMQAEAYRRKMDAPPAAKEPRTPTTWEAELVEMYRQAQAAGDMERANAIADKLNEGRGGRKDDDIINFGGAGYRKSTGEWLVPPKEKVEKPLTATQVRQDTENGANAYLLRGRQNIDEAINIAKSENAPTAVQERLQAFKNRMAPKKATNPVRGRTPTQQDALEAQRQANDFMKKAGQDHDRALSMARESNAPLSVQGLILDGKKKATPPRVPAASRSRLGGSADRSTAPAWKRTQTYGGSR